MSPSRTGRSVQILLVEDNPGDVCLVKEALQDGKILNEIHVASDGIMALQFLRREGTFEAVPRPDFVLLDLNLPKMNGREVLEAIKADETIRTIPVIILSSSEADDDIARAYSYNANCFVTKPPDLDNFLRVVRSIEDFWISIVKLPREEYADNEI